MKLTEKDAAFLRKLKGLMDAKDLYVELRMGTPSHMILRGTYGHKINQAFGMTRQGVRWRFQRVFSDIYVSAFSTILFIEKTFGTELREHAIRISKEYYTLREEIRERGFQTADTLLHHRKPEDTPVNAYSPRQP